jgi:hypothetical protein
LNDWESSIKNQNYAGETIMKQYRLVFATLFTLILLTGCVSLPIPVTAPVAPTASFDDPFAYCAAVGTIDAPDSRYTGEQPPPAVIEGIHAAMGASTDAPDEWYRAGTVWRCADGQVKACFVGANLPCEEKANLSEVPNESIVSFCQENPEADAVPAVASGRATVFSWRCASGTPEIVEQIAQPDEQGFIDHIWYVIE